MTRLRTGSRWRRAGRTVEWDAEIINEKPDELIAWRSLPGSTVDNAGSVHFTDAAGGRGTEVQRGIAIQSSGRRLGALVAKLFGEEPEQQIAEDLRRLKAMMESGSDGEQYRAGIGTRSRRTRCGASASGRKKSTCGKRRKSLSLRATRRLTGNLLKDKS